MANAPHASSDEQKSALGKVRRVPMQRDMFTGNLIKTRPKSGKGDHIVHKGDHLDPVAIPGMAHFAGTGPEGKRCHQCVYCKDLPVYGRKQKITKAAADLGDEAKPRRFEMNACEKAAQLFNDTIQRGGIHLNQACKYFEDAQ